MAPRGDQDLSVAAILRNAYRAGDPNVFRRLGLTPQALTLRSKRAKDVGHFWGGLNVIADDAARLDGTGDETRTRKVLPPVDFESTASTNSATPALGDTSYFFRGSLESITAQARPCLGKVVGRD